MCKQEELINAKSARRAKPNTSVLDAKHGLAAWHAPKATKAPQVCLTTTDTTVLRHSIGLIDDVLLMKVASAYHATPAASEGCNEGL